MANLVIGIRQNIRPLRVEIVATDGRETWKSPILLSSARPEATVRNVVPGQYARIGTRPRGEKLVERVTIEGDDAKVYFQTKGTVTHEFVPSVPASRTHFGADKVAGDEPRIFSASGSAGRSLDALAVSRGEMGRDESSVSS